MTTDNPTQQKLEPCPWCPAIPEPHPEERSNRVYMIVRHTDNCFRSPQLGGYELIERGKLTAWNSRAPVVAPQEENGEQLPDPRGNYTDGFRDGWKAHFDASPPSSPVPPEQKKDCPNGCDQAAQKPGDDYCTNCEQVLESHVAATAAPVVEQEQVQCADCLAWIDRNANHTCQQQARRNQRSRKR